MAINDFSYNVHNINFQTLLLKIIIALQYLPQERDEKYYVYFIFYKVAFLIQINLFLFP